MEVGEAVCGVGARKMGESELSENLGKMALAHIRVFGFLWVAHLQSACTNPADGWGSLKRHFSPGRPYTA